MADGPARDDASDATHARLLSVLARADAARLKRFAEPLIDRMGEVEVRHSRTGLVMLPLRDPAQGTAFHLGEVLVAEAHIAAGDVEGYGMRRGTDLEAAMAMAVIDLAATLGLDPDGIARFVDTEDAAQAAADRETLRRVEATRVRMETF